MIGWAPLGRLAKTSAARSRQPFIPTSFAFRPTTSEPPETSKPSELPEPSKPPKPSKPPEPFRVSRVSASQSRHSCQSPQGKLFDPQGKTRTQRWTRAALAPCEDIEPLDGETGGKQRCFHQNLGYKRRHAHPLPHEPDPEVGQGEKQHCEHHE